MNNLPDGFFLFKQMIQVVFGGDPHQHINIGQADVRIKHQYLQPPGLERKGKIQRKV
ncbi:hypothetical protein D3C76_1522720 [compost metagenome]